MNKKLLVALAAVLLLFTILPSSKAEEVNPGTLAIIDTAINTNLPEIKNNIVYEVCILDWQSCPNKTQYQEGSGSASMPLDQIMKNGFAHGTSMTYSAVSANPDVKVVFVRVVGATSTGARQFTDEYTFNHALMWIYFNKDRLNIKAVAMSQGHHSLLKSSNYCPSTPLTANIINELFIANIPVFLPSGNDYDLNRISWPACIPTSVAVSSSADGNVPSSFTNYDAKLTDIFARGDLKVLYPNGMYFNESGSSISTQIAAASYMALANKYPMYTATQLLDLLKTKTKPLLSKKIKNALVIDSKAVLNG